MRRKTTVRPGLRTKISSVFKRSRNKLSLTLRQYLSRRPHRSFRRTRRRDYVRSLALPGYWAFNMELLSLLSKNKFLFFKLVVLYSTLSIIFIGLSSQSSYAELSALIDELDWSNLEGGWLLLNQGSALLLLGISGSVNVQLTDIQQVYATLIFLLTWLTTVWILRSIMAGKRPTLRDGLYNAGAPILSTGILVVILLLQLMPAIAGVVLFSVASSTELLSNGLMSMLAGIALLLICILSLYWTVSTFFALVIVTLPGMYPWKALRSAGDIVTGRRLRILLRIVWMLIGNVLAVILSVLPLVIVDRLVKQLLPQLEVIPIVPFAISIISSMIVVWSAAYVYVLYRKVVEDDASPA